MTPAVRPGARPFSSSSAATGNPLGTGQVVTQISLALVFLSSVMIFSRFS